MRSAIKKLSVGWVLAFLPFASLTHAEPTCDRCCEDKCISWHGSFENVIVRPHFTRNNAYFIDGPGGIDGQHAHQFDWDFVYSPRIEFGWDVHCGIGVRVRYWHFDDKTTLRAASSTNDIEAWFVEDNANDIGFDSSGSATFIHNLELHVADVDAVINKCDWSFFAGARIVNLDQVYHAIDSSSSSQIKSDHFFDGAGLTAGLEYLYCLPCDFALYGKARVAILFGNSAWNAQNEAADSKVSTSSSRDIIPVGELHFGTDWRRCCGESKVAFVRIGAEAQYWGSAGSAGPGCNAVFDEGNYQNTHPQDSSLGFIGFHIAFGMVF